MCHTECYPQPSLHKSSLWSLPSYQHIFPVFRCWRESYWTVYCTTIILLPELLLWSIPGLMAIARQRVCVRACVCASVRLCVQDLSPYMHDCRYFIHCLWASQRNVLCHDVSSCDVLSVCLRLFKWAVNKCYQNRQGQRKTKQMIFFFKTKRI